MKFQELDRKLDEYKNAIFWDKREWAHHTKSTSGVTTLVADESTSNSAYAYCTDINGQLVTENELEQARELCREVFMTIDHDVDGVPPATWSRCATLAQQNYLRMELESRFAWLKLCSHGWKSKQLAIDTLPSYRQNHPVLHARKATSKNVVPAAAEASSSPEKIIPTRRSIESVDDHVVAAHHSTAKRTRTTVHARHLIRARNPLCVTDFHFLSES